MQHTNDITMGNQHETQLNHHSNGDSSTSFAAAAVTSAPSSESIPMEDVYQTSGGEIQENMSAASASHATAASSSSSPDAVSLSVPPPAVTSRRVKLYLLPDPTAGWLDGGTGQISYVNIRREPQPTSIDAHGRIIADSNEPQFSIFVHAETEAQEQAATNAGVGTSAEAIVAPAEAPTILLSHQLLDGMDYQAQSDTIITWCQTATGGEIAISFLDPPAAHEAWLLIREQLELIQPQESEIILSQSDSSTGMIDAAFDLRGGHTSDEFAYAQDTIMQQHSLSNQQPSRRMVDDYLDAPHVTIDSLESLTQRIQTQRICKRELDEVIQIWKTKEMEFTQLVESEKVALREASTEQKEAEQKGPVNNGQPVALPLASSITSAQPSASSTSFSSPFGDSSISQLSASSSSSTLDPNSDVTFSPLIQTINVLHKIFRLIKTLLLTNDVEVLEILFSDAEIENLIGMLEYDPDNLSSSSTPINPLYASSKHAALLSHNFTTHRTYLFSQTHFKYVIPFYDTIVEHKIHQSYKVTYLKDVILAHHLDDQCLNTLTQIIFVNMVSIISRLTEKQEFIQELFRNLNRFAKIDLKDLEDERNKNTMLERQQTVKLDEGGEEDGSAMNTNNSQEEEPLNTSNESVQSDATQPQEAATPPTPPITASSPVVGTSAAVASSPTTQTETSSQEATVALSSQTHSSSQIPSSSSTPPLPSSPPQPSLKMILLFLQELVLTARAVQVPIRDAFYRQLEQNSLFRVLEAILMNEDRKSIGTVNQRKSSDANVATVSHDTDSQLTATMSSETYNQAVQPAASSADSDTSADSPNWLWLICTDIISNICIHDASLFRSYLIASFSAENSILRMMFQRISMRHLSTSLAHQLSCLIRLVLDPEAMSIQDQYTFLGRIYDEYLVQLLESLRAMQPRSADENPFQMLEFSDTTNPLILMRESAEKAARERSMSAYHIAAYHAIELLSYCALHHNAPPQDRIEESPSSMMEDTSNGNASNGSNGSTSGVIRSTQPTDYFRQFAQRHRVLPTVLNILRTTRRNDLVCSAIRFFRICIGARDSFYTSIILSEKLFEPILIHFTHNGARYNLLNSVVCEMMYFFNATHRASERTDSQQQQQQQQALFNPQSIVFLRRLVHDYYSKYQLDRIQYVKVFQESKQIVMEYERNEAIAQQSDSDSMNGSASNGGPQQQPAYHRRISSSSRHNSGGLPFPRGVRVTDDDHLLIPSSQPDRPSSHFATSASLESTPNGYNRDRITMRRRSHYQNAENDEHAASTASASVSAAADAAAVARASFNPTQQLSGILSSEYYLEDDSVHVAAPTPTAAPVIISSDASTRIDDAFEEVIPNSRNGTTHHANEYDIAGEEVPRPNSSTPTRRIVFGSDQQNGFAPQSQHQSQSANDDSRTQQRSKSGKRKFEEEQDSATVANSSASSSSSTSSAIVQPIATLTSFQSSPPASSMQLSPPPQPLVLSSPPSSLALPTLISSPPPVHSSPKLHFHNPYLHVQSSELPPTAARSPELKPMIGVAVAAPCSSTSTVRCGSPPRQVTPLDLAEDADCAHELRMTHGLSVASSSSSPHSLRLSPRTTSIPLLALASSPSGSPHQSPMPKKSLSSPTPASFSSSSSHPISSAISGAGSSPSAAIQSSVLHHTVQLTTMHLLHELTDADADGDATHVVIVEEDDDDEPETDEIAAVVEHSAKRRRFEATISM